LNDELEKGCKPEHMVYFDVLSEDLPE